MQLLPATLQALLASTLSKTTQRAAGIYQRLFPIQDTMSASLYTSETPTSVKEATVSPYLVPPYLVPPWLNPIHSHI